MPDIATIWDIANGRGDWALDPTTGGLLVGGDLATAVLISLMTDRTAAPDDVIPDQSNDPRGWWADDDVPIGSKIWLRLRSKQTDETLALVKQDIADALQWLIDDGVASSVDILTEWTRPAMLGARVILIRADGTQHELRFEWAWKGI